MDGSIFIQHKSIYGRDVQKCSKVSVHTHCGFVI